MFSTITVPARAAPSTAATVSPLDVTSRTTQPIVTGTSIIGIKYADGVMIAADTLLSYGSMAKYKDVSRIHRVGDGTLVAASGEFSDFQTFQSMLDNMMQNDRNMDDGFVHAPSEVYNYLRAVMYGRRNKFNPLWNQLLIAGNTEGRPFLGTVDMIGTAYEENFIATGFGSYMAIPLIRARWHADMDEGEARALLEDCMRVLYYRDCRASPRIQIAKTTGEGSVVSPPYVLESDWRAATHLERHGGSEGASVHN